VLVSWAVDQAASVWRDKVVVSIHGDGKDHFLSSVSAERVEAEDAAENNRYCGGQTKLLPCLAAYMQGSGKYTAAISRVHQARAS
jgi:hypothetical protein